MNITVLINMANKSYSWYLFIDFGGLKAQLNLGLIGQLVFNRMGNPAPFGSMRKMCPVYATTGLLC